MINFKFIVLFFFYFHALLFFLYNFPEKIFIEAECVIYLYGVYKINSTQLTSSTTQVTMWIRPRKSFRETSRYLQKERKSEREREREFDYQLSGRMMNLPLVSLAVAATILPIRLRAESGTVCWRQTRDLNQVLHKALS